MKIMLISAVLVTLAGCANHPGECALGTPRADCLPGSNGYIERQRREKVAAEELFAKESLDDQKCKSYGAIPGSDAYVNCRVQLDK
jgi:hypothetical protein